MKKIKEKTFTIIALLALILPTGSVLAYNLYIDPFQIFHKDFQQPTTILGGGVTERYQHAGTINQYDIKSMIIGDSHSSNYLSSEVKTRLGWEKIYNLTMNGSSIYEQSIVANRTLTKHQVDNIIWGFSVVKLKQAWNTTHPKAPTTEYLYDNNRLNDLSFFLSFNLQKYGQQKDDLRKKIRRSDSPAETQNKEFDKTTSWYENHICKFNRPTFVASKILKKSTIQYNEKTKRKLSPIPLKDILTPPAKDNIQFTNYSNIFAKNLLPIISENNQTQIIFVFTAYPTLYSQRLKITKRSYYKTLLQLLRQFVLDTKHLDNVKIFGFDNEEFTNDLRLYKDISHYHIEVNNYILEQISQKHGLLTAENIDSYLLNFDKKVSGYRLPEKWNPLLNKKFPKTGYLSNEMASLLLTTKNDYTDEEIAELSPPSTSVSECEKKQNRKNRKKKKKKR